MSRFAARSHAPEMMDNLLCSGEVVCRTLRELDLINQWLGGNRITLNILRRLLPGPDVPVTLADLGCGSGEMLRLIAKNFPQHNLQLTGIDANPHIISYARQHTHTPQIRFETLNIFDSSFAEQTFDIVLATLFLHHFTHQELVTLLKQLKHQARRGIVINDLHRHFLAYHSIRLLTRLFSGSDMVKYDAPLSVLRGFTFSEWQNILREAGIAHYSIKWRWAFRWEVVIYTHPPELSRQ
ncbi:MAG: hypothetical protein KatS3mg032_2020 [Cyclobacteriaceae bacterium]|nr:MAG: hypothetical protein KatS3mg032_2020 [Cyclobacteriaceae bacterium]